MKPKFTDLAIFDGKPTFNETLHVGRPNIGDRKRLFQRIDNLLDRRWLTNRGPLVEEFEQRLAERLSVKNCIAVCNATIALEIVIRALDLSGEVIVPAFTFVATAHALQWQAITPVFCDIDPYTHNIDPGQVERMITPRTSGIIGVHIWGRPCNITKLTEIAERRGIRLLFDAAHAFGCSQNGRMVGSFGAAEVFSFHATKFFNTFEGGAIATNDDELAAKIRLMQNFGFAGMDRVIYVGTNGKMSEISAAMGLTGLENLDAFIATNLENYHAYSQELDSIPGVKLIQYNPSETPNYQYVVLEIDQATSGLSRDLMMQILHAENVRARRYFYPGCHRMEPYRSFFPHAGMLLPETEKLVDRVLSLPTGTSVGREEIRKICGIIRLAIEHSNQINQTILKAQSV